MKTTFHAVAPGVSVAAHELEFSQSRGEEKSLLVLSALGLCALAYKPFAEAFIDASSRDGNDPDDGAPSPSAPSYRRVVFLDLRHHGESKTEDESSPSYLAWTREYLWDTLSADLRAAVRSLNFPPSSPPDVLAHCLGAVAALAAAPAPGLFGSLFLFEPPFYPLVAAAPVAEEEEGKGRRDVAKDNASFAASAAAASALSFGSREDAFSLLEVAPPFKWWHESCKRAFVEHGLRRGGEGEGGEKRSEELVFSCGGQALAALASGLLTSSGGGPSRETYRALGAQAQAQQQQQQRRGRSRVVVISYSAEPRSDITAFLRDGSRLQ